MFAVVFAQRAQKELERLERSPQHSGLVKQLKKTLGFLPVNSATRTFAACIPDQIWSTILPVLNMSSSALIGRSPDFCIAGS